MPSRVHQRETHRSHRAGWLRAAVLGANDGIVSTSCLVLGLISGRATTHTVLAAGVAALIGGSLAMAAGEYVSVGSQRDSEQADEAKEREELEHYPEAELRELVEIYVRRGLDRGLATRVAEQLHERDALAAHLRDELHHNPDDPANPSQAATASAVAFSIGALLPLGAAALTRGSNRIVVLAAVAMIGLIALGATGARLGGGLVSRAALRVFVGGGLAMGVSILLGRLIGINV